ncbi:MAG TPA: alpha/beta hydrolase [Thermomicrobiales bacterium]|nr:alpha/beta hydrolase [Thermomicrobiales bacterium]
MATFVLVHGGTGGGWTWRDVARSLRAAGHEVYTPTLTGMGERVHLAHPDIDLETHILDVANVLIYEQLTEVVLVGASYAGIVITGVADRVPERVRLLVFVDALIPEDGKSAVDIAGPEVAAIVEARSKQEGGWRVPAEPPLTGQTIRSLTTPIRLTNPAAEDIERVYIYCTEKENPPPNIAVMARMAVKAREAGWPYYELATGHSPVRSAPDALACLLLEIGG